MTLDAAALEAALTVRDLAASATWYCDALGFSVEHRHERNGTLIGIRLRAGAACILLTRDDGAQGLDRVKGAGFSLQITTPQDIDALADRARRSGATLDTEPMTAPHGARIFRLRDPDGFRFTVSSPRPG